MKEEIEIPFWDTTRLTKYTFEYDYSGNMTKLSEYDSKDRLIKQKMCSYDDHGKKKELTCLSIDEPNSSFKITYQYDEIKKEVHEIRTNFSNSYEWEDVFDSAGNIISERDINSRILKMRWINVYDKKGNMVKCSVYSQKDLFMVREWEISYW